MIFKLVVHSSILK